MSETIARPPISDQRKSAVLPLGLVKGLLDTLDKSLLVAERNGHLLITNLRARQCLESEGFTDSTHLNLFRDLLETDPKEIYGQIESGEREVELDVACGKKKISRAHPVDAGTGLVGGGDRKQISDASCTGSGDATHGAGTPAGTRDHLPESSCGVSEVAGSEPAENGVPGVRSSRIEDAPRGHQGLL
jgi:hypothetical protein